MKDIADLICILAILANIFFAWYTHKYPTKFTIPEFWEIHLLLAVFMFAMLIINNI